MNRLPCSSRIGFEELYNGGRSDMVDPPDKRTKGGIKIFLDEEEVVDAPHGAGFFNAVVENYDLMDGTLLFVDRPDWPERVTKKIGISHSFDTDQFENRKLQFETAAQAVAFLRCIEKNWEPNSVW